MKSIKSLIQELNLLRGTWEFKAMSLVDEHITELESRVRNLEARNMKYFCKAIRTTVQTIPIGVLTNINFDSTVYPEFGNMYNNVNPARIWIRRSGVYCMFACVQFEASNVGTYREIEIDRVRNGVIGSIVGHSSGPAGGTAALHLSVAAVDYLYEGDYLTLAVLHNANPDLDIEAHGEHSPVLAVSERMEDLDPTQYGLLNPERNMR